MLYRARIEKDAQCGTERATVRAAMLHNRGRIHREGCVQFTALQSRGEEAAGGGRGHSGTAAEEAQYYAGSSASDLFGSLLTGLRGPQSDWPSMVFREWSVNRHPVARCPSRFQRPSRLKRPRVLGLAPPGL